MGRRRWGTSEESILDRVEDTVGDRYDRFERNVFYNLRGLNGELDGQAWDGKVFDYYEAKASLHPRTEGRAYQQFERARRAFGRELRDCYIATPGAIYGPI